MLADILLVLATVTDTFLASLSYGSGGIKIPLSSAVILSSVSTLMLSLSVSLSHVLMGYIPAGMCAVLSFTILFAIGAVQLFQKGLKSLLKKHSGSGKLSFRLLDIGFVVSVYIDETRADSDRSKTLSPKESLSLAAALSMDSISGGIGAGFSEINVLRITVISLALCMLSVFLGSFLGSRISRRGRDMSWVSGAILMVLALVKLFQTTLCQ